MNLCISINSLCPVWVVPSCCAQMQSSPSTRREWFLMESTETQPSSEVKNVISESSFFSDLYLRLPEHQVPFQISIHVFISLRQKKYSVYSHISPILTFDKFKPGMFGGFGKIKNLIYFLSIDQSIHQLIVFGCIEHVSVGWVAAVVDDATDCCVLCRYHRRGDLHHLMYSGVPDPLHVPPQRHLPHQRGQGQRGAHRRIGGHGHHRHRQPRNHRRVQEGVVHLTANGGTLREKVIGQATGRHRDGGGFNDQSQERWRKGKMFQTMTSQWVWERRVQKYLSFICFVFDIFRVLEREEGQVCSKELL